MSFMNRGMQNDKQKKAVTIIIGIVIFTFLLSIVAVGFGF
jgi:flagellar basal body-associated protein FliL